MTILVNVITVLAVLGLPFAFVDGMWSEPSLREFARSFDGSIPMWILFGVYYGILGLIVFIKIRFKEFKNKLSE